ncbi:hypothetical protein BURMUCGD2M_3017 [Burkholderia multivorans CGD2M]|uniref:Uncharacterized protein n=1 Tax=Burkholderia multivorans CGD2 TaxID=513052 RepID=B9BT09_9BURK|nr:hypothetical protein BURMUCGD2_2932 [Burkholderia multivorans CGD2]EEE11319.1 hypothetical protein BURMUCGD2M_3017 [Burkholderia multivorans CGD2M]
MNRRKIAALTIFRFAIRIELKRRFADELRKASERYREIIKPVNWRFIRAFSYS